MGVAERAGIDGSGIGPFTPMKILPHELLILARSQDVLLQFIAEILIENDAKAIWDAAWKLLDASTANKVYQINKKKSLDFTQTIIPEFEHNLDLMDRAGFEKILSSLGLFSDPAKFRSILEQSETRVVRVDVDNSGEGTGWLVANDIIVTADHVLAKANGDMSRVSVVCDFKVLMTAEGQLNPPGRRVQLSDDPLLANSSANQGELSESGLSLIHI